MAEKKKAAPKPTGWTTLNVRILFNELSDKFKSVWDALDYAKKRARRVGGVPMPPVTRKGEYIAESGNVWLLLDRTTNATQQEHRKWEDDFAGGKGKLPRGTLARIDREVIYRLTLFDEDGNSISSESFSGLSPLGAARNEAMGRAWEHAEEVIVRQYYNQPGTQKPLELAEDKK